MKFISVLLFAWSVHRCFGGGCFTKIGFGPKTIKPPLEDELPEDLNDVPEVKRGARLIDIIKTARYEMRPLVMPNWKENEELIRAMVDEAKYDTDQAEKISPSQLNEPDMEALEKLRLYSRQVLLLAQQEGLRLRLNLVSGLAQPKQSDEDSHNVEPIVGPNEELGLKRIIRPSEDPTASIGLCQDHSEEKKWTMITRARSYQQSSRWLGRKLSKSFSSKRKSDRNLEMPNLFCDPALVGKEVIEGLQELLLAIEPNHHSAQRGKVLGHLKFIKAVFRAVDFLYKYRFINEAVMNSLFSKPSMMSLTGKHIATNFLLASNGPTFIPQFNIDLLIMSGETDHIRNCLAGLNETSQTWILHFAFSSFYKSGPATWKWEYISSTLKDIADYLTQDEIAAHLIERKLQRSMAGDSIFELHLPLLIQIFQRPPKQLPNESEKPYILRVKDVYMLNFTLLLHIFQNLCHDKDKQDIFLRNQHFEAKFRLFMIGSRISSLERRWALYSSYRIEKDIKGFPDIQINSDKSQIEENVERLHVEYSEILRELERDERSSRWRSCILIKDILIGYSTQLARMLETMKRESLKKKGPMVDQHDYSNMGSSSISK